MKEAWVREEWRKTVTSSVIEIASAVPLGLIGSLTILKSMFSFAIREKPNPKQYDRTKIKPELIVKKYKSFSMVRNALEIGFPILLGLFALLFSFN